MRQQILAATAVALAATSLPATAYQRPSTVERVSVTSSGGQSTGTVDSGSAAITPDGRYVAFVSDATDLVPGASGPTAGVLKFKNVYVRDRVRHTTRVASIGWDGAYASSVDPDCTGSREPAMSADGRYVAFTSCADNLVPGPHGAPRGGDTNDGDDVFVRDMARGTTIRASVTPGGGQAQQGSGTPTISGDGRYVAFTSTAIDLVPDTCPDDAVHGTVCEVGWTNGVVPVRPPAQAYVRDLRRGTNEIVSLSNTGSPADAKVWDVSISQDGRYVAFGSAADNLRDEDLNACPQLATPGCPDTFVRDRVARTTEVVSVGLDGRTGLDQSGRILAHQVQLVSADGRYVVFRSQARGLVPNDPPFTGETFYVRDRRTHRTERMTVDSAGVPTRSADGSPRLSVDGRYVMSGVVGEVCSPSTVLLPSVHDRATGATGAFGNVDDRGRAIPCAPAYTEFPLAISAGGRYLLVASASGSLVRGDTNGTMDAFVIDRGADLGTGGLDAPGLSGVGAAGTPAAVAGSDLIGAGVVYRPESRDLYVRLDVDRMPLFALASPALVYGVDLTVRGVDYEVRAARTGADAAFGLFRRDGAGWTYVTTLRGGYGTTGQQVVAAVPMAALGLGPRDRVERATAFTGLGGYATGGLRLVDTVRLG